MIVALFKRTVFVVLLILYCCSEKLLSASESSNFVVGKLKRVVDGDTLVFIINGKEEKVRLFGIDTPEKFPSRKLDLNIEKCKTSRSIMREAGEKASEYASSVLNLGKEYKIEIMKGKTYGRLIGWLYDVDGRPFNIKIVSDGFAVVYHKYARKYADRYKKLLSALSMAEKNKAGLWGKSPGIMGCLNQVGKSQ